MSLSFSPFYFFFNAPATTEIYTLSLHDALPILSRLLELRSEYFTLTLTIDSIGAQLTQVCQPILLGKIPDRKSTRLNSSHRCISYAVFCLKKKKKKKKPNTIVLRIMQDAVASR